MLPLPIYCLGPKLINAYWWSKGWSKTFWDMLYSSQRVCLHLHIHDVLIG